MTNLESPLWASNIRVKIIAVDIHNRDGATSDSTPPWTIASDCDARQYLDNTADNLGLWNCTQCPGK